MFSRLFISISISEEIKEKIAEKIEAAAEKHRELPFRFVKQENWHITVLFLGYIKDFEIPAICEELKKVAGNHEPFLINFDKIVYGPDSKNPRMIWLTAAQSKEFERLKNSIRIALARALRSRNANAPMRTEQGNFKIDNRPANIHITLARRLSENVIVNEKEERNSLFWKRRVGEDFIINPSHPPFYKGRRTKSLPTSLLQREEISRNSPPLKENVNLQFKAENVDLMESRLNRGGAEYILLKKSKFKNQNSK